VIALVGGDLQRNKVILKADLTDELSPVRGDRIQLQQVILNLLLNGSDAMRAVDDRPRQLTIRTSREDDSRARLSVEDAGVGIDTLATERMFQAFHTTKPDGMGIGLAVSRSIVERHGGTIWAAANDGPGATFAFTIPLESTATGAGHVPSDNSK
jgi:signal transduction histidine kinase